MAVCTQAAALLVGLLVAAGGAGSDRADAEDVTIVMVGDMLMHTGVIKSGLQDDGSYTYDHLFAHVCDDTSAADIAIVNQETILGGKELGGYTGYPSFNSPFELGDAEAKAGFDVVLHGTNHALDRKASGIMNCLSYWRQDHPEISVLGIHDSEEDRERLCIVSCKGLRIAIINCTYGTNGIQMPAGMGYLVDVMDEKRVREQIARAEEAADFTLVCPHWGTEYSLTTDSFQKKWAQIFLSTGVDLVIGTHPHVIEPVEILTDENGRRMPVCYSIGNFVNDTSGRGNGVMNRAVGGEALARIGRGSDGSVCVKELTLKPVICHLTGDTVTAYLLSDYTEELAEENRFREKDAAFSLDACQILTKQVWQDMQWIIDG
ncbi:MAG: CapA family protein [Lachnospiraceae bacterium]|nr:CapA family protein [Lachnospiraceae bacterium]